MIFTTPRQLSLLGSDTLARNTSSRLKGLTSLLLYLGLTLLYCGDMQNEHNFKHIFTKGYFLWCHWKSAAISAFPILMAESFYFLLSLPISICKQCTSFFSLFWLVWHFRKRSDEELEMPQWLQLTRNLHMEGTFRGSRPPWFDSVPEECYSKVSTWNGLCWKRVQRVLGQSSESLGQQSVFQLLLGYSQSHAYFWYLS